MSSTLVKLIPTPIGSLPEVTDKEAIEKAIYELGIHYDDLKVWTSDGLQFIDCGENLEYIRCPFCHADAMRWWGEAMNQSSQTGFENRHIVTKCCGRHAQLEDLEYCLKTGFARFGIELLNPDKVTDIDLFELGAELGTRLKRVTARI